MPNKCSQCGGQVEYAGCTEEDGYIFMCHDCGEEYTANAYNQGVIEDGYDISQVSRVLGN